MHNFLTPSRSTFKMIFVTVPRLLKQGAPEYWVDATHVDFKAFNSLYMRYSKYLFGVQLSTFVVAVFLSLWFLLTQELLGHPGLVWLMVSSFLVSLTAATLGSELCRIAECLAPLCGTAIPRLEEVINFADKCPAARAYRDTVLNSGRELYEVDAVVMEKLFNAQQAEQTQEVLAQLKERGAQRRHELCAKVHNIA